MAIYLDEEQVREVLDMPMALAAVEAAMRAHARGEAVDVPRHRTRIPGAMLHMLQGAWGAAGVIGYKAYTTTREGARFWLHLFDSASGQALAIIAADYLGMMRTGAAGGVAARALAREGSRVAGVIGAGWQARGQIEALSAVFELDEIRVFARRPSQRETFCREMQARVPCRLTAVDSAQAAVDGADIVVTITNASEPVIEGGWLSAGTHINAAGSNALSRRELGADVLKRAALVCVDSRDVAVREAGDLAPAFERGRLTARGIVELGEVLEGFRGGRTDDAQTTLFESQGMAVQDLALGAEILRLASERGLGTELPF